MRARLIRNKIAAGQAIAKRVRGGSWKTRPHSVCAGSLQLPNELLDRQTLQIDLASCAAKEGENEAKL